MYMTGKVGVTFRDCTLFFLRNLLYFIDFRIKREMTLTALWSASCLSLSMAEYLMRGWGIAPIGLVLFRRGL